MRRRRVLLAIAGIAAVADAYLILQFHQKDEIEVLANMRGFVDLSIGLLNPVVDGPPRTRPPRHPTVSLDSAGRAWISNGQKVADIHRFAYDEPGRVPPIDSPTRYVIVDLGAEPTYGRALKAMRMFL